MINEQIIGGMFGLEEALDLPGTSPPFLKDQDICLLNARSGIALLVEFTSPKQIWMPSYLCGSMLKAVEKYPSRVRFYEVDYDLTIASLDWLDSVEQGDLVIFIDYFGFACDASSAIQARERGALVLEDACQALLSKDVGQHSDFVLFSPRKFLGVPDGGILASIRETSFQQFELQGPPAEWWLNALLTTIERREFDLYGGNRHWFESYKSLKAATPIGRYAMSELTRLLLRYSFDYEVIAKRRVDNYKLLADRLEELAIFPRLPSHTVPLGFPIRVRNRDRVKEMLFDHEIYPPVHWPIQSIVPEEFNDSHRLAAEILTLPCDQRYSNGDMKRMARLVREELKW